MMEGGSEIGLEMVKVLGKWGWVGMMKGPRRGLEMIEGAARRDCKRIKTGGEGDRK